MDFQIVGDIVGVEVIAGCRTPGDRPAVHGRVFIGSPEPCTAPHRNDEAPGLMKPKAT